MISIIFPLVCNQRTRNYWEKKTILAVCHWLDVLTHVWKGVINTCWLVALSLQLLGSSCSQLVGRVARLGQISRPIWQPCFPYRLSSSTRSLFPQQWTDPLKTARSGLKETMSLFIQPQAEELKAGNNEEEVKVTCTCRNVLSSLFWRRSISVRLDAN